VDNRENEASLAVLPDLFVELDGMDEVCLINTTILSIFHIGGSQYSFFHV